MPSYFCRALKGHGRCVVGYIGQSDCYCLSCCSAPIKVSHTFEIDMQWLGWPWSTVPLTLKMVCCEGPFSLHSQWPLLENIFPVTAQSFMIRTVWNWYGDKVIWCRCAICKATIFIVTFKGCSMTVNAISRLGSAPSPVIRSFWNWSVHMTWCRCGI